MTYNQLIYLDHNVRKKGHDIKLNMYQVTFHLQTKNYTKLKV